MVNNMKNKLLKILIAISASSCIQVVLILIKRHYKNQPFLDFIYAKVIYFLNYIVNNFSHIAIYNININCKYIGAFFETLYTIDKIL